MSVVPEPIYSPALSATVLSEHAKNGDLEFGHLISQWVIQRRAFIKTTQLYYQTAERYTRRKYLARPLASLVEAASPALEVSQSATAAVLERSTDDGRSSNAVELPARGPLTDRQYQIALLIAEGLSNDQIASQIVVTSGTVANHVRSILQRLGMRNRAQVAAWISKTPAH